MAKIPCHAEPSSSLSLTLIACSFGLRPPLSSHASILLRRTSCEVAGAFTVTVNSLTLEQWIGQYVF